MAWSVYVGEALIGLGGAVVYGLQRLTTALCGGDEEPTRGARRRAWAEFANTLIAGPLLAGVLSGWAVELSGHRAPWPAVAVAIGLSGSVITKNLPALIWPRLKGAWEALSQNPSDRGQKT